PYRKTPELKLPNLRDILSSCLFQHHDAAVVDKIDETGQPRLSEFGAEAIEYDLTAEYPSEAVKRTSTCWPATCPGQSETSSVIVRAVAVSSCRATTVP